MRIPGLPDLFVGGRPQHGVVRYARELADEAASTQAGVRQVSTFDDVRAGHPLHVHFTDRLFGDNPDEAAGRFEEFASRAPVTVTLHDVPQPSDGEASLRRRSDGYRRVVAAARGTVCNSAHEVALLRELGIVDPAATPGVIPLAVAAPRPRPIEIGALDPVVALVGFVYPGKGHLEVIEAVARLGIGHEVVALGAASRGHEADVSRLVDHAASLGVAFRATGYLSDAELERRTALAGVPIAAHRHVSASGSILAWMSAGRRPLAADSRYTREMLELRPGTMTLFTEDGMDEAISRAVASPGSTLLEPGVATGPHLDDVLGMYARWWRSVEW